jgi:hypothetical protein
MVHNISTEINVKEAPGAWDILTNIDILVYHVLDGTLARAQAAGP